MSEKKRKVRINKPKFCSWCKSSLDYGWKDYSKLFEYLSHRSRIKSTMVTGLCKRHQKRLAVAIKQARHLGLLPFVTSQ